MTPEYTIYALWGLWFVAWTGAMFWSSRAVKRDSIGAELWFRALFYVSVILVALPGRDHLPTQLWHIGLSMSWICVALVATGLLFTWWARIHLGRLWSDRVVRKAGHRVVDTGPYRLVRHPIYAGLIFAAMGTAAEKGTLFAVLGAATVTLAFYIKARREERFLRAELGVNAYSAYARGTGMLLPSAGSLRRICYSQGLGSPNLL